MEIVIKIDDERYKDIQRIAEVQLDSSRFQTAEQVIANGIPLQKGHGERCRMDKSITEILEEIKEAMFDNYCKYPDMEHDNEDWLFEKGSPCETCSLNRL